MRVRMAKCELPGMQHLSGKILCHTRRVNFVAQHRVTEMMKMDANLMGPSGVEAALHETGAVA